MVNPWTNPETLTAFVVALTGLVAAIGAAIGALRAHRKIRDITDGTTELGSGGNVGRDTSRGGNTE